MPLPILAGLLGTNVLVKGLPEILKLITAGGSVREKTIDLARERADAQAVRTAGRVLGHGAHKAVAAVMDGQTGLSLEDRVKAGKELAQSIALQAAEFGEEIIRFADAQAERERTRGKGGDAEETAIDAREEAEGRTEQAAIDMGRVIAGQSVKKA
jgi:hypothetical protein